MTRCNEPDTLTIEKLLLCWALSNALLASLILSGGDPANAFDHTGSNRSAIYMLIVLGENLESEVRVLLMIFSYQSPQYSLRAWQSFASCVRHCIS